jgi:DNA-directed RNA polymerase subunit RPC12/RpoP
MDCPNCGKQAEEGWNFCKYCGHRLIIEPRMKTISDTINDFEEVINKLNKCDLVNNSEAAEQFSIYLEEIETTISELSENEGWNRIDVRLLRDKFVKVIIKKSKYIAFDFNDQKQAVDLLESILDIPYSEETISDLRGAIKFIKGAGD